MDLEGLYDQQRDILSPRLVDPIAIAGAQTPKMDEIISKPQKPLYFSFSENISKPLVKFLTSNLRVYF